MREVAAAVVLPRFQRLTDAEIFEKGPGDLVTVADREAEVLLARGLQDLVPGSIVVGEEAVAADPEILGRTGAAGAVWVIDPVDGTANFAAGRTPFAVMVALLRDGRPVASCILDPVTGIAYSAERGAGAFAGGERVRVPDVIRPVAQLRGPASVKYLPPEVKLTLSTHRAAVGELLPGRNCAGYEYPAIVRDEQQFALFWRTLPWDHAPGVLFVEEAGGVGWHLDATPYEPSAVRPGLLIAQNPDEWHAVRAALLSDV